MSARGLALLGPGLDGQIAIELMRRAGVEVIAATLATPFTSYHTAVVASAERLLVPLITLTVDASYYERVKHPRFGYTREMAPCLDCKVAMLTAAKSQLSVLDAQFLVTGDVVGQRLPGQSKRDLALVDFHAQTEGLVLRLLSGKLLPPTQAEEQGVIVRDQLLDLQGRSRQRQLALAAEWQWPAPPAMTSGCLLADAAYARKVRDAFAKGQDDETSLRLLAIGRHFRLSPTVKAIVGRNADENAELQATFATLAPHGWVLLEPANFVGPTTLVGAQHAELLRMAALLTIRYGRALEDNAWYEVRRRSDNSLTQTLRMQAEPIAYKPL